MARNNRPNKNPAEPATAPKAKAKRVKVRVLAGMTGYYDHARRREGDVFYIDDNGKDFSPRWMERVAASTPEQISTAQQAIDAAHDDIISGRQPATDSDQEGL